MHGAQSLLDGINGHAQHMPSEWDAIFSAPPVRARCVRVSGMALQIWGYLES